MSRITRFIFTATLTLALSATAAAGTWKIDRTHSSVGFSVSHMVISKVTGRFTDFSGSIDFDGQAIDQGSVEFAIQTASINTDNENRDGHLRKDDFFGAEKYPSITFVSTKVSVPEDGEFLLTGDLTMKDVTKEVTFNCQFNGVLAKTERGSARGGFSAETTINRQDFNITWNKTLDAGGLALGNNVEIWLEIESVLEEAASEAASEEAVTEKATSEKDK